MAFLAQKVRVVLKKLLGGIRMVIPFAVILLFVAAFFVYQRRVKPAKVSKFGKYKGYSGPVFDGTQRTSDYLTLSDGTRLAYDLIIPTKKGILANQPLPVLFKYTPYGRAWTIFDKTGKLLVGDFVDLPVQAMLRVRYWLAGDQGRVMDPLFRDRWLDKVVKYGYIVVSVDRPGTGASFASLASESMKTAAKFESEIIDWIADQTWSDGNVGMYGDSQQAMVQFAAASTGNPHLKAIMPAASQVDIYQAVEYPGGVYNKAFAALVKSTIPFLDRLATPVDSDPGGIILAQARDSRKNSFTTQNVIAHAPEYPFHDSLSSNGVSPWKTMDLYPFVRPINQSQTAVYMTVGWYDIFTADMFYWFNNLSVPKRLTVRPTDHSEVSASLADLDYGTEALRWFDYWLKAIDNGIMNEAPIHYFVQDGAGKGFWQVSNQWPLANQKLERLFFGQGKTGSVPSINDGVLTTSAPATPSAADAYTVDYTTTTGKKTRWGAVEAAHVYPDLRANDTKALTYTTTPLQTNLIVSGHPVVHLWLTSNAPDLDAFVYLEIVDKKGKSTYVTEGDLRASHRKLSQAPFDNLGLPYQSHNQADLEPVPNGDPFELAFSLLPSSYQFHAGDRIRITAAFADAGNFDTPVLVPAPEVKLLRDINHPSFIDLPGVQTL
jgi:uncharacterized protein